MLTRRCVFPELLLAVFIGISCSSGSSGGGAQDGSTGKPKAPEAGPQQASPQDAGPQLMPDAPQAQLDAPPALPTGTTDFVSEEPSSVGAPGGIATGRGTGVGTFGGMGTGAGTGRGAGTGLPTDTPGAPSGRVAEVEEADIYKIDGSRLLYFNTYRGFLVFDISNPENPKPIARLPLYGYPIEMFVSGTTVYALIRDALYLTQINGKPQFERYNTSQLVAIDIADPSKPTIIKTVDIVGQLREGVSRKIDNTIYVVSYVSKSYRYSGWGYANGSTTTLNEQAWVYSFDVSDPKAPRKVNDLQIFEGGTVNFNNGGSYYSKTFSDVAISATSNALMVVESWYVSASTSTATSGCGSYESNQMSVVSIIDVSDPAGSIRRHTRFETNGTVSDQFKVTYVYDEAAKTGTFFGIFARSVWSSAGCSGTSFTQNTLESWDITDGNNPVRLNRLDFGKKDELVRGTAYDVSRNVVYAITAQRTDPLYAIDISNPKSLKILSSVMNLSGDMSVFRLISDGKSPGNFLLAIGTDTSTTCTGFDTGTGRQASQVAMSIIDVRDLNKIRLVQRQCVSVDGSRWGTTSQVNNNLDQAHKMIGMYSDEQANVVTVPVSYYSQSAATDWWYYDYKTAVGIMAWDLAKYDDSKNETQQKVISNYGTFVHPNGTVTRTIVFKHPVTGKRSMINLSDTHASIADLSDLAKPAQLSIIELAPYTSEIYRFGDHLVEHVVPHASSPYEGHEFRVRKASAGLGESPVASFTVGQVQKTMKQGTNLILFGNVCSTNGITCRHTALIYDLSKPEAPRRASQITLPTDLTFPYWYYYCGWAPWGGTFFYRTGYFYYSYNNWTATDRAVFFLSTQSTYGDGGYTYTPVLTVLDVSNPDVPSLNSQTLTMDYYSGYTSLVADPVDPTGFYVTYRKQVGSTVSDGINTTQYRNYAQRYQLQGGKPVAAEAINLPGPLVNTWTGPDGNRMFLAREQIFNRMGSASFYYYPQDVRLTLLRQISVDGRPAAELLDSRAFTGINMSAVLRHDNLVIVTGRPDNAPSDSTWEAISDRLMIFDLSKSSLALSYDQPTKAYNLRIMGLQKDRAFLNLQGDGIVVVDTSNPSAPIGVSFLRTLGYATHLETFGNDVYVASGYFGLSHLSLSDPPNLTQ